MHRTGTAEGKYREAMWVLTALQCMDASGISHAFIHNLVDAPGCLFDGKAYRVSDSFLNGSLSGFEIYPELASEKVVRVKVAKHQVGIGHRRLGSPEAVADWTWLSSRRVRPNFQESHWIYASYGATSRANFDHFDHW